MDISQHNNIWVDLKLIFPKLQEKGEPYVKKSVKFKMYLNGEIIGVIKKGEAPFRKLRAKVGCQIDILKGDEKDNTILSGFSFIIGNEFATLALDKDTEKTVKLNFANENRVEIYDERDWDFIDENGEIINNQDEKTDSDNME
jgi:hypothetical protein